MKFKLFGLTIEIKKKVSLEKRLIKEYGARAYKMALIYCKNLTEEGLEETCELAKTNITILAEAMHEGDVLPTRAVFNKTLSLCEVYKDKCEEIQKDKKDADKLIEKLLVKIAEYEEAINKLSNDSTTEPTV